MTTKIDDENKVTPPAPTSGAEGEGIDKDADQDFDKEREALEKGEPAPAGKSREEEIRQATHNFKSVAKRLKKDLGVDPLTLLDDEAPVSTTTTPPVDTSNFVTKTDLAAESARKLAKSESEFKLIMWWVTNKGMSVEDAHLMANKNKIKKVLAETTRTITTIPSKGGGGPGGAPPVEGDVPELSAVDKQRVTASNMTYDPAKKAYVGKFVQLRWTDKGWVSERVSKPTS